MKFLSRSELAKETLPGRVIQKVVGKDGASISQKMTMGFADYSAESGPMEPHHHAEETIYIIDAKDGWLRYGPEKDKLDKKVSLEPGMVLHAPELEWHVFEYAEGGYVDIIFIYGQVENILPEEIMKQK